MDIQAKLAIAEIETKAQNVSERLAFVEEFIKQQHAQAHDAGMQAQDHAHERGLAQQQAEAQSQQSAKQTAQGELDGTSLASTPEGDLNPRKAYESGKLTFL